MATIESAGLSGKLWRTFAPSGVRRALLRRRLSQRHGLVLGRDIDFDIADNVVMGDHCRLGGPVYISGSDIGDYTYIEVGCRISAADVGRFCSIAPYSLIGLPEHPTRGFVSTHPLFFQHAPSLGYDLVEEDAHEQLPRTRVGNDVWIGAGACVKSGVTIGDGAIIGAGAVVVTDVDPYMVVGGVPAGPLRQRFDDDTIAFLLELRWWDRDMDWIAEHARSMQDIDALMAESASSTA